MNHTTPQVSIILPLYNAEKYIPRCLVSLLSQANVDIEVIAIDDGSTDETHSILSSFQEKDSRLILIHQENQGVSKARNKGIAHAKGEYIAFVDGDDWIHEDMIRRLLEAAVQEKAEVVLCSYIREFLNHSKEKVFNFKEKEIFEEDRVRVELFRKLIGPVGKELSTPDHLDSLGTVWGKLYQRNIIINNNINFIDLSTIGTNEDSLFNIYYFYHVKRAVFINQPLYHYWKGNQNSITSFYKNNLQLKWKYQFQLIKNFLDVHSLEETFYIALQNRVCMGLLGLGLNELYQKSDSNIVNKLRSFRQLLEDEEYKKHYKNFDLSHFPFHWKMFYTTVKNRWVIPYYCMLRSIDYLRTRV